VISPERTRKLDAGEVGARNDEHDSGQPHGQPVEFAAADIDLRSRKTRHAQTVEMVLRGMIVVEAGGDRVQSSLCRPKADATLQTCDCADPF
jgi:hypothetical protein